MKDWSLLAKAVGLATSAKELGPMVAALQSLEQSFAPLAKNLTPDMEPCSLFRADEELR